VGSSEAPKLVPELPSVPGCGSFGTAGASPGRGLALRPTDLLPLDFLSGSTCLWGSVIFTRPPVAEEAGQVPEDGADRSVRSSLRNAFPCRTQLASPQHPSVRLPSLCGRTRSLSSNLGSRAGVCR